MDGTARQERIPELRGERVAFVEIGCAKVHGIGSNARERPRPGGRRCGEPLWYRVRPAESERRLDAPREAIAIDGVDGGDDDEVDQISDPRILLRTGERIGVQLLGKMLDHGVDGKFDRSDPGELEEIRAGEEIRRVHERVSAGEVDVERHELEPGHARDDADAQRPAGRALPLVSDLAKLEGEVVGGRGARDGLAQTIERRRSRAVRGSTSLVGRACNP